MTIKKHTFPSRSGFPASEAAGHPGLAYAGQFAAGESSRAKQIWHSWILIAVLLFGAGGVRAGLYTETFNSGSSVGAIPPANPMGIVFGGTVSGIPAGMVIGNLTVSLQISGGYNGNLFAMLVAPNGTTVVLMNQPGVGVNGFGAYGAGMNITFSDASSANIQDETSGSVLSGTYGAAGSLANFEGGNPNGTWDLYFSDPTSGGGTSTLNQWSLNITAVPEPVNAALVIFGAMVAGGWGWGKLRNRRVRLVNSGQMAFPERDPRQ